MVPKHLLLQALIALQAQFSRNPTCLCAHSYIEASCLSYSSNLPPINYLFIGPQKKMLHNFYFFVSLYFLIFSFFPTSCVFWCFFAYPSYIILTNMVLSAAVCANHGSCTAARCWLISVCCCGVWVGNTYAYLYRKRWYKYCLICHHSISFESIPFQFNPIHFIHPHHFALSLLRRVE